MQGQMMNVLREQLLPSLTRDERIVLMLFYAEELTAAEISSVMRVPLDKVSEMIARLRESTQEILSKQRQPAAA